MARSNPQKLTIVQQFPRTTATRAEVGGQIWEGAEVGGRSHVGEPSQFIPFSKTTREWVGGIWWKKMCFTKPWVVEGFRGTNLWHVSVCVCFHPFF